MVYTSEQALDYPADATITNLILDYNPRNTPAQKPAVIDGPTGKVIYTYESLRLAVRRFAKYLQEELQLVRGTVVGVLAFNTVHFPVYVHSILAAGGVVSALNPFHLPQELAHALSLGKPQHVLVGDGLLPNLQAACKLLRQPQRQPKVHFVSLGNPTEAVHCIDFLNIAQNGDAKFKAPTYSAKVVAKELAFICFSSGTSGLPKAVQLSHGNIVANGSPIVVFPKFDLPSLLASIKRDRITHINVVPPIALQLLNNTISATADFSTVKTLMNAAAPLEQSLAERLCQRLGCTLTQWYGLTEASPSVISQRSDQVHIKGTVGKLLPGITMKILDEAENEVKNGTPGELCVSGPNIMQGYLGDTKLTSQTIKPDGFMKTGDIGYVDDAGYVFLVDRLKEMIKVKGNQVAPAELEAILRNHPLVDDAAVRGEHVPEEATDIPVAYITTRIPPHEHEALFDDVLGFVNKQVASYKRIRRGIIVVDQIPRNAGGKILRRMLPGRHVPVAGLARAREVKL
ncbi:hypothetical protein VF21_04904 [Pseudogymnoascus sp. 05NY08]|nr:hypothetical protein VF21_04904 [Pseudogymnoascus sp. 05NY08]